MSRRNVAVLALLCAVLGAVCAQSESSRTPARVDTQSCVLPNSAHPESPAWSHALVLRLHVSATGEISGATVVRSSGDAAYNEKVIAAVRTCRAQPATHNGQAVEEQLNLQVRLNASPNPSLMFMPSCGPVYPAESIRLEETGTSVLRFHINEQGEVTGVEVERSSGHARLDEAARSALMRCQFRPARNPDGTPKPGSVKVEYVWKLQ